MTFRQLKLVLYGDGTTPGTAFPLGTPENLWPLAETLGVEAMIQVQRTVDCWQKGHTDVFPSCETFNQNGATVITKPDGEIRRVYTIENREDGWNVPVPYNPLLLPDFRRWMSRFRSRAAWMLRDNKPITGDEGFSDPSASQDSPAGRALVGIYTIDPSAKRLLVAPWLQSYEALVVEWDGIKRSWTDDDIVSDNPDFLRLIRLWIAQEWGRTWSAADLQVRVTTYREELADHVITCERSKHLPAESRGNEEGQEIATYYGHYPEDVTVPSIAQETTVALAFVGDTGLGSTDPATVAVAQAIVAAEPSAAFIVGDAHYPGPSIAESISPYRTLLDESRLYVALGNHDLDGDAGEAVLDAVSNPGNGRYFNVVVGDVEVFVINSGLDSNGDVAEPDGVVAGSKQWAAIRSMVARSCARWKIAILHHPPFTSGQRYSPGIEEIRWASDLEVHAVIAGHSHQYERGEWRGRPHFIVGTGGGNADTALESFGEAIDGSIERISQTGFLRVTATPDSCRFEFVSAGEVLDSLEVTGDPPVSLAQ